MQVFNNEIHMQQGEQITLTFNLRTKDGSPYIVSSELKNPYYLLTIVSAHLAQQDRYVLNRWCKIASPNDTPVAFYCTKPVETTDITNIPNGLSEAVQQEVASLASKGVTYDNYAVYAYTSNDKTKYYRWDSTSVKAIEYENILSVTFMPETTNEWTGRDFTYGIILVSGEADNEGPRPIKNIDYSQVILAPTKLIVDAKLNIGG